MEREYEWASMGVSRFYDDYRLAKPIILISTISSCHPPPLPPLPSPHYLTFLSMLLDIFYFLFFNPFFLFFLSELFISSHIFLGKDIHQQMYFLLHYVYVCVSRHLRLFQAYDTQT